MENALYIDEKIQLKVFNRQHLAWINSLDV